MERKIILKRGNLYENWGSLTEVCENHPEFKYHSIKGLKYPFNHEGFEFIRVPYRTKIIE